mmetsp:Transcript_3067/g.4463  ORF Transcript_3067/g.4463 Transcript_3067/m.4463 type:complete len:89 (+) Transcript_3067:750-1016(+)
MLLFWRLLLVCRKLNDSPVDKTQKLPSHSQQSTLTQDSSLVKREQIEVGLELGIADGIELMLGFTDGIELGSADTVGCELGGPCWVRS